MLEKLDGDALKNAKYFWGEHYYEEDYALLVEYWVEYEAQYVIEDKVMQSYVKEICRLQLAIHNQEIENLCEALNTLDKLYDSAYLTPKQAIEA